jgi:hypothetical protein
MSRNDGNVTYLHSHRSLLDGDLPLPVEELAEAVAAIGGCLAQIRAEPNSGVSFGRVTNTLLLLQMSTVEQRLEQLAEIRVTTWPDVRWALHFSNARVRALTYVRASAASLRKPRNHVGAKKSWEDSVGFGEVGALSNALQSVRDLIVTRYPQTGQAG